MPFSGAFAKRQSVQYAKEVQAMTYVMTKPCPICKQQLTKRRPTDSVQCACGKHVWQG